MKEEKCTWAKVLFISLLFGSSETSHGTFWLEVEDNVIVLPILQLQNIFMLFILYK